MQKMIYLLQSRTDYLGYSFSWNIFGPVSFQLENDLEEAVSMGFITINYENDVPIYSSIVEAQESEFWKERIAKNQLSMKVITKLKDVNRVIELSNKYPNHLEIIASADYLQKHKGYSIDEAKNDLMSIMENRISASEIEESLNLLKMF